MAVWVTFSGHGMPCSCPLSVLRELAGQGKAHNEKVFEEEQDNYAEPAVLSHSQRSFGACWCRGVF